jgi:hypothetical protein
MIHILIASYDYPSISRKVLGEELTTLQSTILLLIASALTNYVIRLLKGSMAYDCLLFTTNASLLIGHIRYFTSILGF